MHVSARHVVPGRQVGLEQQHRPVGLGQLDAIELNLDETAARNRLNTLARIPGMTPDLLILLQPAIEHPRLPAQHHPAAQGRIIPGPSRARDQTVLHPEIEPLRDRTLRSEEERSASGALRGGMKQIHPDVIHIEGVPRNRKRLLPEQQRRPAIHDHGGTDVPPDPLVDRFSTDR
jgi:hypothetical protein